MEDVRPVGNTPTPDKRITQLPPCSALPHDSRKRSAEVPLLEPPPARKHKLKKPRPWVAKQPQQPNPIPQTRDLRQPQLATTAAIPSRTTITTTTQAVDARTTKPAHDQPSPKRFQSAWKITLGVELEASRYEDGSTSKWHWCLLQRVGEASRPFWDLYKGGETIYDQLGGHLDGFVRCLTMYREGKELVVVHEFAPLSLQQVISIRALLKPADCHAIVYQIDRTVKAMQKQGIYHGHINADTVWLTLDGRVKIAHPIHCRAMTTEDHREIDTRSLEPIKLELETSNNVIPDTVRATEDALRSTVVGVVVLAMCKAFVEIGRVDQVESVPPHTTAP